MGTETVANYLILIIAAIIIGGLLMKLGHYLGDRIGIYQWIQRLWHRNKKNN